MHAQITVPNVHRINRPGIGAVHFGTVSIEALFNGLHREMIRYAPKYQRGFKQGSGEDDYDKLFAIDSKELDIDRARCASIAAKYLMSISDGGEYKLFNSGIIWNARREGPYPEPEYNTGTRELIIRSPITIPDSGHRHFAYYMLMHWKKGTMDIPDAIRLNDEGETCSREEVLEWLEDFHPENIEDSSVLVEIYNLTKDQEGRFFDELNMEAKKPSNAASIDMYPSKTPARRFVTDLMSTSEVFSEDEIERRSNTIGSKSRKLTTNATLVSAIKPFSKKLLKYEETAPEAREDLIAFFAEFYREWARLYPEYEPDAGAEARQSLRKSSYALSNIMFFPMFRLAFELWEKYQKNHVDWSRETEWRDALARIGGETDAKDPDTGETTRVAVMARETDASRGNPAWRESILVPKHDRDGKLTGWSLSSTRQTREAAYHYLKKIGLGEQPPAAG